MTWVQNLLQGIPPEVQTILISILTSGLVTTALRIWLKATVDHKYAALLLQHRKETDLQLKGIDATLHSNKLKLDAELQAVNLAHQAAQARTERFFDHQREAFANIALQVSSDIATWESVLPIDSYNRHTSALVFNSYLQTKLNDHQIFIDPECQAALDLLSDIYLTYGKREDDPHEPQTPIEFHCAQYLRPRIVALFQKKIGVPYDVKAVAEIGILGVIWHISIHGPEPTQRKLQNIDLRGGGAVAVVEHARGLVDELKTYAVEYQVRTNDISGARKIMSYAHLMSVS